MNPTQTNIQRQHETLTEYLREIVYPSLFGEDATIHTPTDLAIMLHGEFVSFLGENQADWFYDFAREFVYLESLIGETEQCAIVTLRSDEFSRHIWPFIDRRETPRTRTRFLSEMGE